MPANPSASIIFLGMDTAQGTFANASKATFVGIFWLGWNMKFLHKETLHSPVIIREMSFPQRPQGEAFSRSPL